MVERVARLLASFHYPQTWLTLEQWQDCRWRSYERQAREIIPALREPTEAMVEAGNSAAETCVKDDPCGRAGGHVWSDMIDAALK